MKNKHFWNSCLTFFLLFCVIVTGCASKKDTDEVVTAGTDEYILYFVSIDSTQLVPQAEKFNKSATVYVQVEDMLEKLTKAADSLEYKNILPDKVKLQSFDLNNNGILTIDLSSTYYKAVKSAQVLCRAAFVKSLTQINGVDMIEFTVDTQAMMDEEKKVGALTSDYFVDSDDGNDSSDVSDITVYFTNITGDKLEPLQLPVNVGNDVSAEQLVIEALLKGTDEKGYYNTVPEGTKLLSVSTKDGVCYVDFNKDFMNLGENVKDQVVIYSVVNSLCELSTVSKVAFTIEGSQEKLYNGNIAFDQLFERNLDIVDNE